MPAKRSRMLWMIVVAGIVSRLLLGVLTMDLSRDYYWEYGEIAKNIHAGNGFSLFHVENGVREYRFDPSATPLPTAYMSPGYVWFLYPFFFIENVVIRNLLILLVQAIIGGASIMVVASLAESWFRPGCGIWAAGIAGLLPEFVYAASSYTPTIIYHLGVLLFLGGAYAVLHEARARTAIALGAVTGLLVLLRAEFLLCGLLLTAWLFGLGRHRTAMALLATMLLVYCPWSVRNAVVFGEFVPTSTSSGLNLFRGNNAEGYGTWTNESIEKEISRLPVEPQYEPRVNGIFLRHALEYIRNHPGQEALLLVSKAAFLWGINPLESRSLNPLYIVPWGLMLLLAVLGAYVCRARLHMHLPLLIFLLYSSLVAVVFLVLPRYQTMMKIALVPFTAVGCCRVREWIEAWVAQHRRTD